MVWAKRTMAWCGRVGVGRGESGKARRPAGRCEDEDKKASRLRPVQGTVCAGTFKYCGSILHFITAEESLLPRKVMYSRVLGVKRWILGGRYSTTHGMPLLFFFHVSQ